MTTVTDVLDQLGIPHREGTRGWLSISCPWCGVPGKPGLGIPLDSRRVCSCFKCGTHRLGDALAEITGRPLREILSLLGEVESRREPERKRKGKLVLPAGLSTLQQPHIDYLRGRGFDPEELQRLWQMRGIGLASRLAWRVFIPVIFRGEPVSWTARSISDDNPMRYVAANRDEEAMPAKSLLLGEDYCRHAVIVCEGAFDAMRIGPGAVATMGTAWTRPQLRRIIRYPVRAVAFDSEPEAQRRAARLCDELAPFPGKTIRVEVDAGDPGSASPREVARLRKEFLE